jgi:hypothetical protein
MSSSRDREPAQVEPGAGDFDRFANGNPSGAPGNVIRLSEKSDQM